MPDISELFASMLFGTVGFAAFMYAKKTARVGPMVLGIILMVYPYFISSIWLVYVIGCVLCAALYFWRD